MYTVSVQLSSGRLHVSPRPFGLRLAVTLLLAVPAGAQTQKVLARTPDGQPDLQGVWTNATLTPFERPAQLAGKATITEQEAAAIEKRASENRVDRAPQPGDPGSYNQVFFDSGTTWLSTRQ